ncbi:MAG: PaaI family thioesterase [Desulfobacterales bacterium]|nr:PaaI family thioesterase [Desulfobacterales bacterium]
MQEYTPAELAVCYGCGWNNARGLHIKTYWDGEKGVARFTPASHHAAYPGSTYGGLLASLIDCHSVGTAVAAAYQAENRSPGSDPAIIFVTGNLNVTFKKPTPLNIELVLTARVLELSGRKAKVACIVEAGGQSCVTGEVIAIRIAPEL